MPPKKLDFSHMGFYVKNLPRMQEFYTGTLGFKVTDEGMGRGRPMVFLSRDPNEHHQIVMIEGRDDDESLVINQISLRAGGLEDLRDVKNAIATQSDITAVDPTDHGCAWSLYFRDPEGNRVEIFIDTPWYVAQPRVESLDLDQSDEEIAETTLGRIKDEPTFRPLAEWREEFAATISAD
jgi:catechol 2,3-dioxygenase